MCLEGTKSLPIHSLSDLSKEISARLINTLSNATPTSIGMRLGDTASPINSTTRLAALAHYLWKQLGSLWLCRPVLLPVPLAPPQPDQKGQGRSYSGPQLCAESVWMNSIAWGTSLERASRLPRLCWWLKNGLEYNVCRDWSGRLTCMLLRMWYGQTVPLRYELILWWKTIGVTPTTLPPISETDISCNLCFSYHVAHAWMHAGKHSNKLR